LASSIPRWRSATNFCFCSLRKATISVMFSQHAESLGYSPLNQFKAMD
jgi:hypothetical protein